MIIEKVYILSFSGYKNGEYINATIGVFPTLEAAQDHTGIDTWRRWDFGNGDDVGYVGKEDAKTSYFIEVADWFGE